MAEILSENIKTKEILDWQGIHLLHFSGSSCSQKLRIFLNYKGIKWQSHSYQHCHWAKLFKLVLGNKPKGACASLS
jgi:hypothetical protein